MDQVEIEKAIDDGSFLTKSFDVEDHFYAAWRDFKLPWGIRWARSMIQHIAHYFFDLGCFYEMRRK